MGETEKAIARIGYAADSGGRGIVYARIGRRKPRVVRTRFHGNGLGAVAAIAPLIRKQVDAIELQLDDEVLVETLTQRRDVPGGMLMAYVRARCALNAFRGCRLTTGKGPNDLTARARAEVSLRLAA